MSRKWEVEGSVGHNKESSQQYEQIQTFQNWFNKENGLSETWGKNCQLEPVSSSYNEGLARQK